MEKDINEMMEYINMNAIDDAKLIADRLNLIAPQNIHVNAALGAIAQSEVNIFLVYIYVYMCIVHVTYVNFIGTNGRCKRTLQLCLTTRAIS